MIKKILPLLVVAMWGCGQQNTPEEIKKEKKSVSQWQPPAAGTGVAKVEERITEDKLNEKYFRVEAIATADSKNGNYDLRLAHGFNTNETSIDLPKWVGGVVLKPVLKKGDKKYSCDIGFDTGDGQFHELYQVRVNEQGNITLKQTRGYYQAK